MRRDWMKSFSVPFAKRAASLARTDYISLDDLDGSDINDSRRKSPGKKTSRKDRKRHSRTENRTLLKLPLDERGNIIGCENKCIK